MLETQLETFLVKMFNDRTTFVNVNGVEKSTNIKYMLVADAVSENIKLLIDTLKESV